MTEILEKISAKGMLHRVVCIGNQDFVFEVMVREKGGVSIGSSTVTMECQLWPKPTHVCAHAANQLCYIYFVLMCTLLVERLGLKAHMCPCFI